MQQFSASPSEHSQDNDVECITSENDDFDSAIFLSEEQITDSLCDKNAAPHMRKKNIEKNKKNVNTRATFKNDTKNEAKATKQKTMMPMQTKNHDIQNNFSCLFFINEKNNPNMFLSTCKSCVEPTIFCMDESQIFEELLTQMHEECPSLAQNPEILMSLIAKEFKITIN